MDQETRVVDPKTGGAKGSKLAQLGAVDPAALLELARVAGMGGKKYDRYNFLKGYAWSLSFDALARHLLKFWGGDEIDTCTVHQGEHEYDPETCDGSGLPHMAHAAWHCLALISFSQRKLGTDDRYHQPATIPTYEQVFGAPAQEPTLEQLTVLHRCTAACRKCLDNGCDHHGPVPQ